MTACTLIVIAKEPFPGEVKTRLQSRFSPQQAALLAEAALADTLAAVAAAPATHRLLVLDGRPGPWVPPGFRVAHQAPGGLDTRLEHAFEQAFAMAGPAGPADPVLLIGMDTPQVTPELLSSDWGDADAVLGLADDGGWWAAGLRRRTPGAFIGVPMSTDHTGADQLARFRELGLNVRLLPPLRDVDTPADADAVAAGAPATRFARMHRQLSRSDRETIVLEHPLDLFAAALAGAHVTAELPGGQHLRLDVDRWTGTADGADRMLLSRCEGAVLDLGCGPGRLVGALAASGQAALGVDICHAAVQHTADRGASVLLRSVHDRLPAEGRWGTVLLADGNIGISGDPDSLLKRCADLLCPMGLLLVEADADEGLDTREQISLVSGDRRSHPMPWARLGCAAVIAAAERTGFLVVEEWRAGGRVFLALRSPGQRSG